MGKTGVSVNTLHPGKLAAILPGVRPCTIVQRVVNGTEKATWQGQMATLADTSMSTITTIHRLGSAVDTPLPSQNVCLETKQSHMFLLGKHYIQQTALL